MFVDDLKEKNNDNVFILKQISSVVSNNSLSSFSCRCQSKVNVRFC